MRVLPLRPPNQSVVALLKSLLRQAEAGELRSLIYSADLIGGKMQSGYTVIADCYAAIGQLERMKYLLQRELDDGSESVK